MNCEGTTCATTPSDASCNMARVTALCVTARDVSAPAYLAYTGARYCLNCKKGSGVEKG